MTSTEYLTEREQQALELGATLKGYASRFGLDVQQLKLEIVPRGDDSEPTLLLQAAFRVMPCSGACCSNVS
jgi:hypothetical protein